MITPAPAQILKFLRADMSAPMGTGRYTVGRWRSVRGVLVPCQRGLHAAVVSNLVPFASETLWLAEIGDEFVWHGEPGTDTRKLVARRMRVVERVEAWNERIARLFAADCAERVLPLFEARHPEDNRPRQAIEVARRFANGEATAGELRAAYSAADRAARAERTWQSRHLADMLGLPWDAEAAS